MTISKSFLLLLFSCLVTGGAYAQSPGQPVTQRQLFPSDVLNVHSPNSEGWIVTGFANNGISFGKRAPESNETYGTQAIIFEMPPTTGHEEFIGLIKKRIALMNPPPRFQETESDYRYTEDRGYPCVNVHVSFDDFAAVTPEGKQKLKLQVVALYCRHPEQQQLGFFAAYSHRGKTNDDQMESAAIDFIAGVDIPKK